MGWVVIIIVVLSIETSISMWKREREREMVVWTSNVTDPTVRGRFLSLASGFWTDFTDFISLDLSPSIKYRRSKVYWVVIGWPGLPPG